MFASTYTATTNITTSKQSYKFFCSPLLLFRRRTNLDFTSCSCENEREKRVLLLLCIGRKSCNERIKRSQTF